MTIGDRIRELRKYLKLNQTDFGNALGVAQGTVTGWEIGIRSPSDAIILSICREFSVNEEWLVTGSGPMFRKKTENEELSEFFGSIQGLDDDNFRKKFMLNLSRLSLEGWRILEAFCKSLALKHEKEGQE